METQNVEISTESSFSFNDPIVDGLNLLEKIHQRISGAISSLRLDAYSLTSQIKHHSDVVEPGGKKKLRSKRKAKVAVRNKLKRELARTEGLYKELVDHKYDREGLYYDSFWARKNDNETLWEFVQDDLYAIYRAGRAILRDVLQLETDVDGLLSLDVDSPQKEPTVNKG